MVGPSVKTDFAKVWTISLDRQTYFTTEVSDTITSQSTIHIMNDFTLYTKACRTLDSRIIYFPYSLVVYGFQVLQHHLRWRISKQRHIAHFRWWHQTSKKAQSFTYFSVLLFRGLVRALCCRLKTINRPCATHLNEPYTLNLNLPIISQELWYKYVGIILYFSSYSSENHEIQI